jgi:hypothetical protein
MTFVLHAETDPASLIAAVQGRLEKIGIGVLLAIAVATVIQGFMFGVGAIDPATIGTVFALLAAIALTGLAAYLPARRIIAGNPIAALGRE